MRERRSAPDDAPRLSQQVGIVTCAYDARQDACAARTVEGEAACQAQCVAESCYIAEHGRFGDAPAPGACDRPLTSDLASEVPTFEQYDDCLAAVRQMSCCAVGDDSKPSACANVLE